MGYKTSQPDLAPIFFPIMAIIINPDIVKFWPTRSKFITPSHFRLPLVCKSACLVRPRKAHLFLNSLHISYWSYLYDVLMGMVTTFIRFFFFPNFNFNIYKLTKVFLMLSQTLKVSCQVIIEQQSAQFFV